MISQALRPRHVIAVLAIAVVAGCVPALQPMLFGGLLAAGRMDAAAIGRAATAEGLGMAVAATIASACFAPRRLRLIGAAAILAALAGNLLTLVLPAPGIIAARGLSGAGNGVLLWILVGMITRSAVPAKLFAIYVTAQASLGFTLSLILATLAIPRYGILSGYVALIAMNALLLLVVRMGPSQYVDLVESDCARNESRLPPRGGVLALMAIVIQLAGVMAFWIYSVPLGAQAGIPIGSMQMIIGTANGAQIIAGLAAVALASRLTGMQAVTGTALVGIATLIATNISGSALVWYPAMFAFVFCWMFGPCFHIPFLLGADRTGRAAMFVSTAQLVGMAIGPLLASLVTSSANYYPARSTAVVCFALVLAIAVVIHRRGAARASG